VSYGYNSIPFTVAKFCGFLILTFPSPISAKKMADTICCVRRLFSGLKISRYIPKRKSFYFVTLITEKFDSQTLCLPAKCCRSWLVSVVDLADAESRALDVGFFTLRAASGAGETFPAFKHIAARQTCCLYNGDLPALR
jgi:hypothetical protein